MYLSAGCTVMTLVLSELISTSCSGTQACRQDSVPTLAFAQAEASSPPEQPDAASPSHKVVPSPFTNLSSSSSTSQLRQPCQHGQQGQHAQQVKQQAQHSQQQAQHAALAPSQSVPVQHMRSQGVQVPEPSAFRNKDSWNSQTMSGSMPASSLAHRSRVRSTCSQDSVNAV